MVRDMKKEFTSLASSKMRFYPIDRFCRSWEAAARFQHTRKLNAQTLPAHASSLHGGVAASVHGRRAQLLLHNDACTHQSNLEPTVCFVLKLKGGCACPSEWNPTRETGEWLRRQRPGTTLDRLAESSEHTGWSH
jgi:hypothetical protein